RPAPAGGRPTSPGGRSGGPPRPGGRTGGGRHQGQRGAPGRGGPTSGPNGAKAAVATKPTGPVTIPSQIMVKDLAELLGSSVNEIIRTLITNGVFANLNQVISYEAAAKIAEALAFEPSEAAAPSAEAGRAWAAAHS